MNQSCNYTSVIPSIRRISLYSYNLSLLAVARGLEVVPSPCGDLLFLESHLFSLKLLFLPYVYFVYLKKKKRKFFFMYFNLYFQYTHVHLTLCRFRGKLLFSKNLHVHIYYFSRATEYHLTVLKILHLPLLIV